MAVYLGIDTSNYTTSVAAFDTQNNTVRSCKKLLPVNDGTLGLRQSDAVFAHTKQLAPLLSELMSEIKEPISAIGVSTRPRDIEGSYMPCFLTGQMAAQSISSVLKVPVYGFSHQAGHIMAALYGSGKLDLADKEFIAFHFSGGTTDCLLVKKGKENPFLIEEIATSNDLKAGQAIDRVGGMLGLSFPAGMELDKLASSSSRQFKHNPAFKRNNPCLSGIENKCSKMLTNGEAPADIAKCCIDYICAVADKMTATALDAYPGLPVVYAGGVMCNSIIKEKLSKKYGGSFAPAQYSADNACGTAILASFQE